jgi:GNAT superfamily N-acetyltransferase
VAIFAANAISPKNVAEPVITSNARRVARTSCGAFGIVTGGEYRMVRDATPADAEAIVEFQIAMARETEELALDRHILTKGVHALFANPSLGRYYVAEADGQVVGSLMITYEWSDWRNGMVWWIQSVYVTPSYRRKGIYAGLYAHVRELVEAEPSIRGIRLYVDTRNTIAQEVYARLGMSGEHYKVFEWMK